METEMARFYSEPHARNLLGLRPPEMKRALFALSMGPAEVVNGREYYSESQLTSLANWAADPALRKWPRPDTPDRPSRRAARAKK